MDVPFFSKPLSQLECRDNKNPATCRRRRALIQWECMITIPHATETIRMQDFYTTNTTCNRSNQNARLSDTHSRSTNQHPATPDTTKTMCYQSTAQWWKAFLVMTNFLQGQRGGHGPSPPPRVRYWSAFQYPHNISKFCTIWDSEKSR